ncbi:MAG: excinuclease ABC subunit UvrA, partial [Pseudonocardiaceae bacterium]
MENLTTPVVVDQQPVGGNARSTVGTITDIYPMIRALFARYGSPTTGHVSSFSFNHPQGMCPECDGLGQAVRADLDLLLDRTKSLNDGAILFPLWKIGSPDWQIYANSGKLDPARPLNRYSEEEWQTFLHGKGWKIKLQTKNTSAQIEYEGFADRFDRYYLKRDLSTLSEKTRDTVQRFITDGVCPACDGARLNETALASRIEGRNIADLARMEITDLIEVLSGLDNAAPRPVEGFTVAAAARTALERVAAIGLGYLTLDRPTTTLSGGEGQRLKLVRHLGASLTGMTYIFDEPSIGLHPHDVGRLNALLRELRDKGNTVLVVEHDPDVIEIADHIVDVGPQAGAHGGSIVFEGTFARLRTA